MIKDDNLVTFELLIRETDRNGFILKETDRNVRPTEFC